MEAVRLQRILIFCLATFLVVCASREERKMSNRTQNQPSLFTSSEFNPSNRTINLAWHAPPSAKPSSAPTTTYPTKAPTFFPSASPTEAPTPIPSERPVLPVTFTRKLQLTLSYMENPMNVLSQRVWSQVTSDFIIAFWKTNDASQSAIFVQDLNVTTIFESQETVLTTNSRRILNSRFRRRVVAQQQQRLQVSFLHQISYSTLRSTDSSISNDDPYTLTERISTIPFDTVESRNQYILNLQETQDVAFQSLEYTSSVSPVSTFQPSQLQQQQSNSSISFLQTNSTWIVGVAALMCVLVLLIGNYMFRAYKRQWHGEDSATKASSTSTVSEHHVPRNVTVGPKDHHSTTDTNSVTTYRIESSHLSECDNMFFDFKAAAPEHQLRASDFNVVEELEQIVAEESASSNWPFLIGYFVDTKKKKQSSRQDHKEEDIIPPALLSNQVCNEDKFEVVYDDIADDCSKADCSVLTNCFPKSKEETTPTSTNDSLRNSHASIRSKEDASQGVVPNTKPNKIKKGTRRNYSNVVSSSKASTTPSLASLSKNDDTATTLTKYSLENTTTNKNEEDEYYSGDEDRYNNNTNSEEEEEEIMEDSLNRRRSNSDPKKKSNGITIICCGDVLFADKGDTVIL